MELYRKISDKGYNFEVYIPSNEKDPLEFQLRALKEGKLVKEVKILMCHEPLFGVDASDLANLEKETDELIKSLP